MRTTAHALVPVKAFTDAKTRLSPLLDEHGRRELAIALATRSIRTLVAERPTTVVADDAEVLDLAGSLGAATLHCSGPGLDLAVTEGLARLAELDVPRAVVVHSDLPLLDTVADLDVPSGVAIATDRHGQGTNAIGVAPTADVRWAYGAGSLHRHRAEALRLGLAARRVHRIALAFDLDTPADLRALPELDTGSDLAGLVERLLTDHSRTGVR